MTKKERTLAILEILKKEYPMAVCSLDYDEAWKLLVIVRLAAQCTDERVNKVVIPLFETYPDPKALSQASEEEIEKYVHPCGLGKSKARDIKACMEMLVNEYNGRIPDTMEELLRLPGVGRKSANLILGDVFHKPAIVTDTHCIRITNRLGLTDSKQPYMVEKQLLKLVPAEEGNDFCHRLVMHGRAICSARKKPECSKCCLYDLCLKKI